VSAETGAIAATGARGRRAVTSAAASVMVKAAAEALAHARREQKPREVQNEHAGSQRRSAPPLLPPP
jgi:hypothetical protein